MNGDVYKLSEKMVFGKAAWAEQMPWIVQKHSQAELKAKIQAGETLQFQRGTETVSFVPSLSRKEFTVHITGKPQPSPLAVKPIQQPNEHELALDKVVATATSIEEDVDDGMDGNDPSVIERVRTITMLANYALKRY